MSKKGNIRVSTEHQETARQQEIMDNYKVDRIFSEKLSGANADRPQLRASRGDFCRYSALTVMNVEEDTEDIKQIARYISSISNSFNQVAHRVNKGGKLYDEDIADMKARLEEVWRLLVSIRSTREHTVQLLISATQTKPQTANMLLATCAYLLHVEHQNNSKISESVSAQDEAEASAST